jgi:hypothetical protein
MLQRAPDAFDEEVVHPAAAPVHRDAQPAWSNAPVEAAAVNWLP